MAFPLLDYLSPKDGPVIAGMESDEVVYAENQPEYKPLRALISGDEEHRVTSRWTLTPEQRIAVANGADIFLELMTFGQPLQPICMAIGTESGQ